MPTNAEADRWRAATTLAASQLGLVRLDQLLGIGCSRSAVARACAGGRLRRLHRGVFEVAGLPPDHARTLLAAVFACGPEAWLCGPTAIAHHDLPAITSADGIHVLRPWHARGRHDGVVAHRSRLVVPADRTVRRSIPVVSVARAIVDVSGHPELTDRDLAWLVDVARRRGLRLEALRRTAQRLPPGPGRRPRRVIALVDRLVGTDPAESIRELAVADVLEAAGYGRAVFGLPVVVATGERFRLDGAFVDCMVAFEYQSWEVHGQAGWTPFHRDARRIGLLRAAGWDVHEITSQMTDAEIVHIVGSAIEARRAAMARGERFGPALGDVARLAR